LGSVGSASKFLFCGKPDTMRLLTKHRLSNNVGGVKHFLSTLWHMLREERHFALVEELPIQPRLARNRFSGQELSSTHASLRSTTSIMIAVRTPP
jgi:hypothetical protein